MIRNLLRAIFHATPRPLRHLIRDWLLPESLAARIRDTIAPPPADPPPPPDALARALENRLWGGFHARALADLEAMRDDPRSRRADISHAAWALARWHACRDEFEPALRNVRIRRLANMDKKNDAAQILLETDCLTILGQPEKAREILLWNIARQPPNEHLDLAMANVLRPPEGAPDPAAEAARLGWINRVFLRHGLAPLAMRDPQAPLCLDNLAADLPRGAASVRGPKVSVLIPAYGAEATLHHALDSLLAQTWADLEIVVADDCSPDGAFAVAQDYAARDPRVIAVRTPENGGAYAARTLALAHATGEYITVHDSDDWSHPQKIAVQAGHLRDNPQTPATVTSWVRCHPDLFFRGTARPTSNMVQRNHSALMLRRGVLEALGGWDRVRIAADTDLIRRLEHAWGADAVVSLVESVPLSFALELPGSLTRQSRTHVHTLQHGVRRVYREAARHWLAQQPAGDPALPPTLPGQARAFPAPGFILPEREERIELDLLAIADFNTPGPERDRIMARIAAAEGQRIGVFHWPLYDSDVTLPLWPELLQLAQEGKLCVIAPAQVLAAELVLAEARVLETMIDLAPGIEAARFVLLEDAPDAPPPDTGRIERTVAALCGLRPEREEAAGGPRG